MLMLALTASASLLLLPSAQQSPLYGVDVASREVYRSHSASFSAGHEVIGSTGAEVLAVDFDARGHLLWGVGRAVGGLSVGVVSESTGEFQTRALLAGIANNADISDFVCSRLTQAPTQDWFAASPDAASGTTELYRGVLPTGAMTAFATVPGELRCLALIRSSHVLGYRSAPSEFVQISTSTGAASSIPVDPTVASITDMDFDPLTGQLHVVALDHSGQSWFGILDPSSGDVTFLDEVTALGSELRFAMRRGESSIEAESLCSPAVINQSGRAATITASGSLDLDRNDFVLTASDLPASTFGLFLASLEAGTPINPPGSVGNLCLSGSVGRISDQGQPFRSGPFGSFRTGLDLGALAQPSGAVAVLGLDSWFFQSWFRDSAGGAATSNFSDAIRVRFHAGSDALDYEAPLTAFRSLRCFTTADVDGDGLPELLAAGKPWLQGPSDPYVRRGTFTMHLREDAPRRFRIDPVPVESLYPVALRTADLDLDGDLDLVVAHNSPARLRIYLNSGAGEFTLSFEATICVRPLLLEVADLDGDGLPDIVMTCTGSRLKVFFGMGSGAFMLPQSLDFTENPSDVALVDLDGDGAKEIVCVLPIAGEVEVRSVSSTQVIGLPVRHTAVAGGTAAAVLDQNVDGAPDVVVAGSASGTFALLRGVGDGSFLPPMTVTAGPEPVALAVMDFDGDGLDDLLVTDGELESFERWRNSGSTGFELADRLNLSIRPLARGLRVADLDGNGALDAAVGSAEGFFHIVWNASAPLPSSPVKRNSVPDGYQMLAGDFNGDSDLDVLVTGYGSGPAQLFPGQGDGTFASSVDFPALQGWNFMVATGDLDADGDLDIAWLRSQNSDPQYALNDGSGTMTVQGTVAVSSALGVTALRLGDITGDGLLDVVMGSHRGVTVMPGEAGGGFGPERIYVAAEFLSSMALSDMDQDGLLDVVAHGYLTGNVGRKFTLVFFNDGGALEPPTRLGESTFTEPIAAYVGAGDFDGNGLPDLLAVVQNTGEMRRLLSITWNLGSRRFSPPTSYGVLGTVTEAKTGDIDRDGDLDIVAYQNSPQVGGAVALFRGDGGGTAFEADWYGTDDPDEIVIGDFDGDGSLEIVVYSSVSQTLTTLRHRD